MSSFRIVHWRAPGRPWAWCSASIHSRSVTTDAAAVTCQKCTIKGPPLNDTGGMAYEDETDEYAEEAAVPDDDHGPRLLFELESWRASAACRGESDLFFGKPGERPEPRADREAAALAICAHCPVLMDCREFARTHREYDVWGGETEHQRALAGYAPDMPVGTTTRIAALSRGGRIAR